MTLEESLVMSAEEARAKTKTSISEASYEKLQTIVALIDEAIDEGHYTCSFEGTIDKRTEEVLTLKGYKVTRGSQYNESYVNISWKE